MTRPPLGYLALAALLSLACRMSPAAEEEEGFFHSLRVTASDHLLLSNAQPRGYTTGPYTNLFMNEGKPRVEYDEYSFGLHFTNRYTTNGPSDNVTPFYLEKGYATADWTNWTVKLGDSYQVLGRGIALALYQDPAFGIDNTLQGGAVRYRPGVVDTTVFAGRVNPIHNPVAINAFDYPLKDADFYLAGGSLTANVTSATHIGGHYLRSMSKTVGDPDFNQIWDTAGVTVARENLVKNVDVYGEFNRLASRQPLYGNAELGNGYGSYASVTWSPSPWQVRLEGIDYRNYNYYFQKPPTLEDQSVAFLNTEDEEAARLYGEYRLDSGATVYSSVLTGWDRQLAFPIYHPIAGAKFDGPARTHFDLRAGYREMAAYGHMWHGSLGWKIHTGKGQNFELDYMSINWLRGADTPGATVVDNRNIFTGTYTFSEKINVALGYEWVPQSNLTVGHHFFNLGGTYKTGGLTAKAFVGQTSGGMRCSGGICRQVPAYSGGLVETTYVF